MLHAFIKSKRGVNLYERKRHNNLFPGGSNIPTNNHHIIEAAFKAFAKALDQATMIDNRLEGIILSTKGSL